MAERGKSKRRLHPRLGRLKAEFRPSLARAVGYAFGAMVIAVVLIVAMLYRDSYPRKVVFAAGFCLFLGPPIVFGVYAYMSRRVFQVFENGLCYRRGTGETMMTWDEVLDIEIEDNTKNFLPTLTRPPGRTVCIRGASTEIVLSNYFLDSIGSPDRLIGLLRKHAS